MKWIYSLLLVVSMTVMTASADNAELESSGCAHMLATLLNERAGQALTEADAFWLLLLNGDVQKIAESNGFSLMDIRLAAKAVGVEARAYRSDDLLLDLAERTRVQNDGPYLLLQDRTDGADRFMLYDGEEDGYVWLRDPFAGKVRVPASEFNGLFVPYVVIIDPISITRFRIFWSDG